MDRVDGGPGVGRRPTLHPYDGHLLVTAIGESHEVYVLTKWTTIHRHLLRDVLLPPLLGYAVPLLPLVEGWLRANAWLATYPGGRQYCLQGDQPTRVQ